MATLKKTASTIALAASLGAALLGIGSGVAGATPALDPGMIPMDHGHGWGDGDWNDHHGWHGRGWGGGPSWDGPSVYIAPPCVTGPLGYVTVCA